MPIIVGIAGGTGSGKTTVARAVAGAFLDRAVVIEQDCFYIDRGNVPFKDRKELNFDHPDSIDVGMMVEILTALKAGGRGRIPQYDFTTHTRKREKVPVGPADVIVVEGILILHYPELRNLFDLKVFVQTDSDIRLIRRIKRDLEERGRTLGAVFSQYIRSVKPMHEMYVEPSKHHADIIIPEGGFNVVGVETIISQVSRMLRHNLNLRNSS
ncbi:MAG: uridine kinase [Peptococcaceae bacterium]|nr:uridine kinase [Peptococcaceae bacterium]